MGNKKQALLELALRLEEAGTIPTDQICKRITDDLKEPIRYGILTPRYIRDNLPDRFKDPVQSCRSKAKSYYRPIKLEKLDKQRQIIRLSKQITDLDDLDKLLNYVKRLQK